MVSRVAQYDVLFHGGFEFDDTTNVSEKKLIWKFPEGFVHGTNLAKPMLAFMLVPLGGKSASFKISVNHREILSWGPIRTSRGLWAPFSARVAFPENTSWPADVQVRIYAIKGRMRFENVVMWSQVRP